MTNKKIAIIGLGYVGLPLAVEFSKKYRVLGFDINKERILELSRGKDHTKEVDLDSLLESLEQFKITNNFGLEFSSNQESLKECNIYIVTVPTPIDQFKNPDLAPILNATKMLGMVLKKNDLVIYESTVYPGCTEEDCVPVLEKYSGLKYNTDFYCGYSPERINPGDKINTLTKIVKVTSGSNPQIADMVDDLYKSIILAGTFKAKNIKVAEASKAIENAQRDLNISFVNELALIFDRMNIDTQEVLAAAGTKWNFLKYQPGLVGGHCISVDPYYLAHKAKSLGYYPQVILSGRRVNDHMGVFIANKVVKLMIKKRIPIKDANVLVLGITFKENCGDIRNSRVIDIINELDQFGLKVHVYDPHASINEVKIEYNINMTQTILQQYDAVILTVAHNEFKKMDFQSILKKNSVLFDIKAFIDNKLVDCRL